MSVQGARAAALSHMVDPFAGPPYQGYTYGYPHKTAYRTLTPALPLAEVWHAGQPRSSLDLYIHVAYCTMRCGFCNLFTQANPHKGMLERLVTQIEHEAEAVAAAIPGTQFARVAVGGGTPTILPADLLERLLSLPQRLSGAPAAALPVAVESSPDTITPEKLAVLKAYGVTRLSLGIQSFDEAETKALGRPQRRATLDAALGHITDAGFQTLNLDLIYGAGGQTRESWLGSIKAALSWKPDEICLYPLYVRPLTGLGKQAAAGGAQEDQRLDLYRHGRDLLMAHGFAPANMRLFRREGPKGELAAGHKVPSEGTIGLGCGARSITRGLHYSSEYAVGRAGVQQILASYLARAPESFGYAHYGLHLSEAEQRRRSILLQLMETDGVSRENDRARYGADPLETLPQLGRLAEAGLAVIGEHHIRLTVAGLERSDAIGPWLYSAEMVARMEGYAWR